MGIQQAEKSFSIRAPQPLHTHTHTQPHTLHGKYAAFVVYICLSYWRFNLGLERRCSKHWTNLLTSAGDNHADTSLRLTQDELAT